MIQTFQVIKNNNYFHLADLIASRKELHLKLPGIQNEALRVNLKLEYRQMSGKIYRSSRKYRKKWSNGIAEQAQLARENLRNP